MGLIVIQIVKSIKAISPAHYLQLCWVWCVQLGFSLLYNQFAFTYDLVSWLVSLGAWREWQQAALPFIRGPRVLEIAHGPGHMLLALRKQGFRATGIDLSAQMGRLAQERAFRAGMRVSILRSSAQALPFSPSSFDSVLATFPTEFILERSTLIGVHRILCANGLFVIVLEAKLTGDGLIERAIEWSYYVTGQRRGLNDTAGTNPSEKEPQWLQLHSTFQEVGFLLERKIIALNNSEVTVLIAQKMEWGLT